MWTHYIPPSADGGADQTVDVFCIERCETCNAEVEKPPTVGMRLSDAKKFKLKPHKRLPEQWYSPKHDKFKCEECWQEGDDAPPEEGS